ncbi:MAG: hypothetical protein CMQ43_01285 [Gammaproteobacteria bacterium]|nr:hypothetical protein [Gammaproteobacteria bacterium]
MDIKRCPISSLDQIQYLKVTNACSDIRGVPPHNTGYPLNLIGNRLKKIADHQFLDEWRNDHNFLLCLLIQLN